MNPTTDETNAVERLQRRLTREKSARLQAESIAERVTSERWQLREHLEEKLALRTSELQAARQAATDAITAGQRFRASVTHELRTALTALIVHADSLSAGSPTTHEQIGELRTLIARMHAALEAGVTAPREGETGIALADIVAAREAHWLQLAARYGKLLILDLDNAAGATVSCAPGDVDARVREAIASGAAGPESVIEIRLSTGPSGLQVS
ncbi:hypothetical protein EB72_01150 [Mycobacterium sp. SWH-M1]|nr:hypothetical protein EB72_01150 [Mycobacterium sp. SWH-M1]